MAQFHSASSCKSEPFIAALQCRCRPILLNSPTQQEIAHYGNRRIPLQIDGIKGESNDSAHQGWIEVASAQWGVVQPILAAPGSATGGRTTGRSEYRSMSITKLADLSSPVLMQHCSTGKTIPKAKLEFMRADGDGKRIKYYEVELENVLIGSMEQMVAEGSILHDSIGLLFSKVKWKYTQQKIGGGIGGNTAGGWDLACNKSCA